jgi:hypothetical protein
MKQYAHLAVPLLIAAACAGPDQRTPTAPATSPGVVVGLSEAGSGRLRPFHAALWIVP